MLDERNALLATTLNVILRLFGLSWPRHRFSKGGIGYSHLSAALGSTRMARRDGK
jgi:hypothetical protein